MTVQNAVICTAVLLLFAERDRSRNRWSGLLLEFLGLFTALVAMNGVWEALFHRPGSYFATHLLLMAGYVLWLGRLNSRQYLVTIILFYAVETAGIVLSSIIPEILLPDSYGTLEIVLRNLAVLSTLAAAAFFRKKGILGFQNLNPVSTVYALLIGAATAVLAIAYSTSRNRYDASTPLFALLAFSCILVIDLVAYYMNYAVACAQEREKQLVIENYMAQNDRELRERVLPQTAYIDCGNRTVSAILNLETAKARAQGISLDYRCMVEPSLSVRDSDLCALMTNLIDNALEAMVRQRKTDGAVEVGLRQKGSSLYLCVVNPVDGALSLEELLSLRTTKEDDALHGYGHKIVEGIAARHDGAVNREVQGGRYIVDVVLDMTCAERGGGALKWSRSKSRYVTTRGLRWIRPRRRQRAFCGKRGFGWKSPGSPSRRSCCGTVSGKTGPCCFNAGECDWCKKTDRSWSGPDRSSPRTDNLPRSSWLLPGGLLLCLQREKPEPNLKWRKSSMGNFLVVNGVDGKRPKPGLIRTLSALAALLIAALAAAQLFLPALRVGELVNGAYAYNTYSGIDAAFICWPAFILGGELIGPNPVLIAGIVLAILGGLILDLLLLRARARQAAVYSGILAVIFAYFAAVWLALGTLVMNTAYDKFKELVHYAKENSMYGLHPFAMLVGGAALAAAVLCAVNAVTCAKLAREFPEEAPVRKPMTGRQAMALFTPVMAVILALAVTANILMNQYSGVMDNFFGQGAVHTSGGGSADQYYTDLLNAEDYSSKEASKAFAEAANRAIVGDGVVLLKNENNTLPLASGTKITLLGADLGLTEALNAAGLDVLDSTTPKASSGLTESGWTGSYLHQRGFGLKRLPLQSDHPRPGDHQDYLCGIRGGHLPGLPLLRNCRL